MVAVGLLCELIGIDSTKLSKKENLLLEANLYAYLYEELKAVFRKQYKEYFQLMKFTVEMEEEMLEANFLCLIINDIVVSEEYTLEGIACYSDTPVDVMQEILIGYNKNPSAILLRKVIELHRSVRRELYSAIMEKIYEKIFTGNMNRK